MNDHNALVDAFSSVDRVRATSVLSARPNVTPAVSVVQLVSTEMRELFVVTAGISIAVGASRRRHMSWRHPVELLVQIPPDTSSRDITELAIMLQHFAEYGLVHHGVQTPGTVCPCAKPIFSGTHLRALFFGGYFQGELADDLTRDLPTHPKFLQAALLTSAERRVVAEVPWWQLWSAALSADVRRVRCAAPARTDRTDAEQWGLFELFASVRLAQQRSPAAIVALEEALELLRDCRAPATLLSAAELCLLVGRALRPFGREQADACFHQAAALGEQGGGDRGRSIVDAAHTYANGEAPPVPPAPTNDVVLRPEAWNDGRLVALGLSRQPTTSVPIRPSLNSNAIYEPGPPLDFVVDLVLPRPMRSSELAERFPPAWLARHAFPAFRGRITTGKWVDVWTRARGYRERTYDAAQFVVRIFDPDSGSDTDRIDVAALGELVHGIAAAAPELAPAPRSDPATLLAGIAELQRIVETYDRETEVTLVPRRSRRFDGLAVWEAMHGLGLVWGAGDKFVFDTGTKGDDLFVVKTRTSPGYFLPEEIAAGTSYEDLVFSLFLPGLHHPERDFALMIQAVGEARTALSGTLLFRGEHLDDRALEELREYVRSTANELRDLGWPPGSVGTRELFGYG